MTSSLFNIKEFTVENSSKIACLTTGWRGKISGYAEPINALNERGFTVIGYEFNPMVLIGGKPQTGVDLLNGICDDFSKRSAGLKEIICVGSSAGAGLGLALQRRLPEIKYGIYAGAGEPGKDVLARPLFYFLRKRFEKSGNNSDKVRRSWRELDIAPDEPPKNVAFVIVLGEKDRVVRYNKALPALAAWQKAGVPIKIISKPNMGHRKVISWQKSHISELVDVAERLL